VPDGMVGLGGGSAGDGSAGDGRVGGGGGGSAGDGSTGDGRLGRGSAGDGGLDPPVSTVPPGAGGARGTPSGRVGGGGATTTAVRAAFVCSSTPLLDGQLPELVSSVVRAAMNGHELASALDAQLTYEVIQLSWVWLPVVATVADRVIGGGGGPAEVVMRERSTPRATASALLTAACTVLLQVPVTVREKPIPSAVD